jgi:hypothetical protein
MQLAAMEWSFSFVHSEIIANIELVVTSSGLWRKNKEHPLESGSIL